MHTRTYVSMHVSVCSRAYVHTYVCTYTYTYTHIRMCVCVCVCVCMFTSVAMRRLTHTFLHVSMHMHMHMSTHRSVHLSIHMSLPMPIHVYMHTLLHMSHMLWVVVCVRARAQKACLQVHLRVYTHVRTNVCVDTQARSHFSLRRRAAPRRSLQACR